MSFLQQCSKSYLKFSGILFQARLYQPQVHRTFSILVLLEDIMGKIRNVAGPSKQKRHALDDPSTALHEGKKSSAEKLFLKQNVKFKTKFVDAAGSHISSKGLSVKGKRTKLQKDVILGALNKKSHKEKIDESAGKEVKMLSAGTYSKLSPKAFQLKRVKRVAKDDEHTFIETDIHPKKSLKNTDNIPLAVEMPKVIDASDTTLSDLNTTTDMDVIQDKDTNDSVCRPVEPDVGDSLLCLEKRKHTSDIPLAVTMPISASSTLPTKQVKKKKRLRKKNKQKIRMILGDKDKCEGLHNSSIQVNELNRSSQDAVKEEHSSSRALTKRDQDTVVLDNLKVHLVGSSIVVQLSHSAKFFIFGQVEVQVLSGKIEILGYVMNNKSTSCLVSSLRGSSFLSFYTKRFERKSINLPAGLQDEPAITSLIEASDLNDVWVLLKEGDQAFLEYIQMYLEYPISVKELKSDHVSPLSEAQQALNCVFQPEPALGKRLKQPSDWHNIAEKIIREKKSCTVLCGGKGVGKSTLLRYLVNQILSSGKDRAKGVVVLDFDPGQAELTPPGCVAVSLISEPLLGPNYTHLQSPERCVYIGEISVTQCLGRYMEASASIIKYFQESPHLQSFPCIVNTMGFTQGIGVTIMGELLKFIQPTRVVQIESKRERENYPFYLTSERVLAHWKSSDSRCIRESLHPVSSDTRDGDECLDYEFLLLQSAAQMKTSKDENVWGMKPKVSRDAVILSYFSSLVQPPSYSILDNIPFSCPLGNLFLCIAHERVPPNLILSALNGNMVALCSIEPTTSNVVCQPEAGMPHILCKVPIAPCLGFGIVRGVDMHAKMLYLTTPLKEDTLSSVNCLIFGVVNLPTSVYIKQSAPGLVPYVSSGHHPNILIG